MPKQLIQVASSVGGAINLNPSEMLSAVRTKLENQSLMSEDQDFIISSVPLLKSEESSIPLSDALVEAKDGGLSTLTVGTGYKSCHSEGYPLDTSDPG